MTVAGLAQQPGHRPRGRSGPGPPVLAGRPGGPLVSAPGPAAARPCNQMKTLALYAGRGQHLPHCGQTGHPDLRTCTAGTARQVRCGGPRSSMVPIGPGPAARPN